MRPCGCLPSYIFLGQNCVTFYEVTKRPRLIQPCFASYGIIVSAHLSLSHILETERGLSGHLFLTSHPCKWRWTWCPPLSLASYGRGFNEYLSIQNIHINWTRDLVPTFSALVFLQTGGGLGAHLFLPYISAHRGSGLILIMNNSPAEMLRTGIGEGDGEQVFCRLCL